MSSAVQSTYALRTKQYTRCHKDINPLSITPMGPYPEVEEGYENDWSKLRAGEVKHPLVVEAESKL